MFVCSWPLRSVSYVPLALFSSVTHPWPCTLCVTQPWPMHSVCYYSWPIYWEDYTALRIAYSALCIPDTCIMCVTYSWTLHPMHYELLTHALCVLNTTVPWAQCITNSWPLHSVFLTPWPCILYVKQSLIPVVYELHILQCMFYIAYFWPMHILCYIIYYILLSQVFIVSTGAGC